jgi:hypothetical protein
MPQEQSRRPGPPGADHDDEFNPIDGHRGTAANYVAGAVMVEGRHARTEAQLNDPINGTASDPDQPHGTAANHTQASGGLGGRHVRADHQLDEIAHGHDSEDVVTRARHVRGGLSEAETAVATNGSTPEVVDPPEAPADLTQSGQPPVSRGPMVEVPPRPELPATVTEASDFLSYSRRRRLTRFQFIIILIVLVVAAAAAGLWWAKGRGHGTLPTAHVTVTTTGARTVVALTKGSDSLPQLRRALAHQGHAGLIASVPGGAVEVEATITVGRGGALGITKTALLLSSSGASPVELSAQGGRLDLLDDTVSSWTSGGTVATDAATGRPDLIATGRGAQLNITNCQVVGLGTNAASPGVSWTYGASGTVMDSHFSGDWRAASAFRSGPLTFTNSSFSRSLDDGALLIDPGAGTTIKDSTFDHNAQSGLDVDGTVRRLTLASDAADHNRVTGLVTRVVAGQVAVTGGLLYDNGQFGLSAIGGRVTASGTKAWDNTTGFGIDGGTDSVHGVDLSGNKRDGMYVAGAGTTVTASSDRFDHNSRAGVWVNAGRVTLTGGLLDENDTGIRVEGTARSLRAIGNTITDNLKDGLALDVSPSLDIRGNVIDDNGASAISTDKKTNLKPLFTHNSISHNQTATRIRGT